MTLFLRLRHEAPPVLALLALAVVQLWPAVGPERLPESLDLMLQYVPNVAYLQRSLLAGAVPLWNPFLGTGMPFAADPGSGAWYLLNWPALLTLPLYGAVRVSLYLHLFWAALGTYAFCRASLAVGRAAALTGAVALALTTWLPALTGMPAVLTSVAWLPWIVMLGDLTARRGGRWCAGLALAAALQVVSGWPAAVFLAWLTLGVFLFGRGLAIAELLRVALVAVLALLLAGVLLVPALEFIGESSYAETRSVESAAREAYLTLLSWLRPAGGSGSIESSQLYLGIPAMLLAVVGALSGARASRTLSFLAGLALVVAMGTRTPLFGLLYTWLPGFRIVYLPARLGIVAAFALAALAALGQQRVQDGHVSRRSVAFAAGLFLALVPLTFGQFWLSEGYDGFRRLLTNIGRLAGGPYLSVRQELHYAVFGVAAIGAVWIATSRRRRLAPPIFCVLLVSDVVLSHQLARPAAFDPASWYAPAFETADRLGAAIGHDRVVGAQWHGTAHFLTDFARSADPAQLPPNISLLVGLRDAQGYNPLLLRRSVDYFAALNARERGDRAPDDHWLWIEDFRSARFSELAVARLIAKGAEWRVRSYRALSPTQLKSGDATARAAFDPSAGRPVRLHVVSYLGEGTSIRHGEVVGEITIATSRGTRRHELRVGVETAEWAYGRPDVARAVAHGQAPIALRTQLVDAVGGRFWVYEYHSSFDLPIDDQVTSIELTPRLTSGVTATLNVSGVWIETGGVLPEESPGVLRHERALPRLRATLGTATLISESAHRIEAGVESLAGTTVTLADALYPGWIAQVDGQVAPLSASGRLFRSLEVPAGRHTVVFSYEPDSLKLGAAASVVGTLIVGALALGVPLSRPSTMSSSVLRNTSRP